MLYAFVAHWREIGIEVDIGLEFEPTADLGFLHHNFTRLSTSDIPPARDGMRVLNGKVLDISKRIYSELMLAASDDWDGPVIVKTNQNYFGTPERFSTRSRLLDVQRRLARVQRRFARSNWKLARCLPDRVYPVLNTLSEVPNWVWARDDLLVERFMPEREGDLFAIRGWIFLGSASYGFKLFSTDPMVKVGSIVRHEYIEEVPPELEAARQSMGFDYGKFDYVVHGDRAILLDANKTPTFVGDPKSPRVVSLANAATEFLP